MKTYDLTAFDRIEPVEAQVQKTLTMAELPAMGEVRSLATWSREMVEKFDRDKAWYDGPPKRDRSQGMAEFAYLAAEHRWSDEQIYAALLDLDDRIGKYVGRRDREKRLIDFINRARTKVGYDPQQISAVDLLQAMSQTKDNGRFVWDLDDFLAADFKIEWLLDGLHERGGFGMVTGFPGVGKTQFALALGMHMAAGAKRFLEWDNVAEPQKVMFLSLEMGKAPLHLFLSTIAKGYTGKRPKRGMFQTMPLGAGLPLDQKDGQAFLEQQLVEHMPDIVIIDSLQKIVSKELTDEIAVKELVEFLRAVRMKHGCSMVVVHHNRKKSNDAQKRQGVELSDVYGSIYLTAEVDWVLSLRTEGESKSTLLVDSLKNRLGVTKDQFTIRRNEFLGFDLDGTGDNLRGTM